MMLNSGVLKCCKLACNSGFRSLLHTSRSIKLSKRGRLREDACVDGQVMQVPVVERSLTEVVIKTGAFAVGFTGCCFVGCSLWEQYNRILLNRRIMNDEKHCGESGCITCVWKTFLKQLDKEVFNNSSAEKLKEELAIWGEKLNKRAKECYKNLWGGHEWFACIAALNLLVFAGWRVKALRTPFCRFFTCSTVCKSLLSPMVLSAFSHQRTLHLLINMYVLYSFAIGVCGMIINEQATFLYISGAVWGSFAGLAYKALTRNAIGSVGASGAILALLGYRCCKSEDARFHIIFLPMFTFSSQTALVGVALLDICGVIFKWKVFDHACHLGGLFFGIWYAKYGEKWLWEGKRLVLNQWVISTFGRHRNEMKLKKKTRKKRKQINTK